MRAPRLVRARDLIEEAVAGIAVRPLRALLTVVGTVAGIAALVATVGLATTARQQVSDRFDIFKATELTVVDGQPHDDDPAFPADADQRVTRINGVVAGGVLWGAATTGTPVSPLPPGFNAEQTNITVFAASPGVRAAVGATMGAGRGFTEFERQHAANVALLGRGAAQRLGMLDLDAPRGLYVGGVLFTVVGIVDDVDSEPQMLASVIVPSSTATRLWGAPPFAAQMVVRIKPGAADVVAAALPLELRPTDPARLQIQLPPDPKALRNTINSDLTSLFIGLAGLALFVGVVGIANTTLVSVMERTREIGLRRALGARRRDIAGQFLLESAVLGLFGGLVGAAVGVLTVVGAALAHDWTAVLDTRIVFASPVVGLLTGLIAGVYPATKAAALQPLEALRR